jgi:DNA-binding protein HU-beta
MTKQELIDAIASHNRNTGTSKTAIQFVLEALGDVTTKALKSGGEVTVPGIGKLSVQRKEARTGRNPKTGESLEIPAKNVPKFSAAKALKDAVA